MMTQPQSLYLRQTRFTIFEEFLLWRWTDLRESLNLKIFHTFGVITMGLIPKNPHLIISKSGRPSVTPSIDLKSQPYLKEARFLQQAGFQRGCLAMNHKWELDTIRRKQNNFY